MSATAIAKNGVGPRFQRQPTSVAERSSAAIATWRTSSASAKLPSTTTNDDHFDFTASVAASSKNSAFTRNRQGSLLV